MLIASVNDGVIPFESTHPDIEDAQMAEGKLRERRLLHLAGSTDRLLTYARGEQLSPEQCATLDTERRLPDPRPAGSELVERWNTVIAAAISQLGQTPDADLLQPREIGRARLPTTVLGLLFHAAEHAARHAGQVVTTMRLVTALPDSLD